jgi:alginate O-acetyltransferase complex protein AlgI
MLFNSIDFLLLFLPVVMLCYAGFALFGRVSVVLIWLICCSLFFHAYWKASYTWLLVASICVNYVVALGCRPQGRILPLAGKTIAILGVSFNLVLLGYFKYALFLANIAQDLIGWSIAPGQIVLPLAISFYTFQQIAYLVDCYRGEAPHYSFLEYFSYLAFFPHLIAGPIVQHSNLVHQLKDGRILKIRSENLFAGLGIIFIGLFKKVVLGDGAAAYANPIFAIAASGTPVTFFEAWIAAFLFSCVIYFDFSGYSDMAIGLARLFNITFPENFASPYKSVNVVEFWRRWHITLSAFLRKYLYGAMGGNRRGNARRYMNILITMLLGGLWHGAAWTFVIWGGLHGVYIVACHMWHRLKLRLKLQPSGLSGQIAGRIVTYLAVVIAWIFFRATNTDHALSMLYSMVGGYGVSLPKSTPAHWKELLSNTFGEAVSFNGLMSAPELPSGPLGHPALSAAALCVLLHIVLSALPNTQQIMWTFRPVLHDYLGPPKGLARYFVWRPTLMHVAILAGVGMIAMTQFDTVQSFIYFRF